jgi:putative ABC transport system permease protein
MNLIRFAIRNIAGNSFRSWMVFFCATLMAAFVISATLIIGGANDSLRLALDRLGADIIVIPEGHEQRLEAALLMGIPVHCWMPDTVVDEIAQVDGVTAVSPQLYLSTLRGASCCSVPEMFLIAYEPETDFTLRPWLEENLEGGLAVGEAVGGSLVYVPQAEGELLVYGYGLDLKGSLSPTGTGLDQSMFFTFETAHEIARLSPEQAVKALDIPPRTVSSAMVKVDLRSDPYQVAEAIDAAISGVTPLETNKLFKGQREQILSLLNSVVTLLVITWVLAMALIAVVFSLAVNERRRHIGVMRALGASRATVLKSLLLEAMLLALAGGGVGIVVSSLAVYLFRTLIIDLMGFPFLFPAPLQLAGLGLGALTLALLGVTASALVPALRISFQDPAISMRE